MKKEVTLTRFKQLNLNLLHFHVIGSNIIITGAKVASSFLKSIIQRNCKNTFFFRFYTNQNPFDLISNENLLDSIVDWNFGNLALSKLDAHKIFMSRDLSDYKVTILHRDITNRVLSGLIQDMKRDLGKSKLLGLLDNQNTVDNFLNKYFAENSLFKGGDHLYSYTFCLMLFFQKTFSSNLYSINKFKSVSFLYIEDDIYALENLVYNTSDISLESIKEQGESIYNSNKLFFPKLVSWFENSNSNSKKLLREFINGENFTFKYYFDSIYRQFNS